jgi:hypothetical protein
MLPLSQSNAMKDGMAFLGNHPTPRCGLDLLQLLGNKIHIGQGIA